MEMDNKELPFPSSSPQAIEISSDKESTPVESENPENEDLLATSVEEEIPGEYYSGEDEGEEQEYEDTEFTEYPWELDEEEQLGEVYSQELVGESDSKLKKNEFFGEDAGEVAIAGEGGEDAQDIYIPRALSLTEEEKSLVENHWGFLDFDIVLYTRGDFKYEWLKRGDPMFTVDYGNKLYFFISEANRDAFMKRPRFYIKASLPLKIPPKIKPIPRELLPPGGFLISTGIAKEFQKILVILLKKKPRFPFLSLKRSGILYIAYYLKSQDMTSPPELRNHYLKAMFHLTETQKEAQKLCAEVNKYHGCEYEMPVDMKAQMEKFIKLSHLPDNKKLVDPYIPNCEFNYEAVPIIDKYAITEDVEEVEKEIMSPVSIKESVIEVDEVEELNDPQYEQEEEEFGEGGLGMELEEFVGEDGIIQHIALPKAFAKSKATIDEKNLGADPLPQEHEPYSEDFKIYLQKYSAPAYTGKYRMY